MLKFDKLTVDSFNSNQAKSVISGYAKLLETNGKNTAYNQSRVNQAIAFINEFSSSKTVSIDNVNQYLSDTYSGYAIKTQVVYAGMVKDFLNYCILNGIINPLNMKEISKHVNNNMNSVLKVDDGKRVTKRKIAESKSLEAEIEIDESILKRYETTDWDDFELEGSNWKCWA